MGRGGRFGKYGEQKRRGRLRQKQRSIIPLQGGKKLPKGRKTSQALEHFFGEVPQIAVPRRHGQDVKLRPEALLFGERS